MNNYRQQYESFGKWFFTDGKPLIEKIEEDTVTDYDAFHALAWHAWIASYEENIEPADNGDLIPIPTIKTMGGKQ